MQAFNYYTQQFQQMFTHWKYDQKNNSYTYQQYGYTPDSWPVSWSCSHSCSLLQCVRGANAQILIFSFFHCLGS